MLATTVKIVEMPIFFAYTVSTFDMNENIVTQNFLAQKNLQTKEN